MLQGSLSLRPTNTRPRIEALLATKSLDLTPYLEQSNEIKRGSLENGRKTSIAAWNSSKIDFSALRLVDGVAQLKADKLDRIWSYA